MPKNIDINKDLIKYAKRNDIPTVLKLLAQGANVNACDGNNKTALQYVAGCNFLEMAELLLMNGANPNHYSHPANFNSPLIAALNYNAARFNNGHVDMVKLLIKYGVDLQRLDNSANRSFPLIIAAMNADLPMLQLLIEQKCDINPSGIGRKTPLLWAIENLLIDREHLSTLSLIHI